MKNKLFILLTCMIISLSFYGCSLPSSLTSKKNNTKKDSSVLTLGDNNEYYGNTFGQGSITDINIKISDEDLQDILDNPMDEKYHSADVTVNGTTVENAGFRTKGFSSLNGVSCSDSNRYGFRVKLDKYVKGQTLNGLDDFVLNASYNDASYMREYLTYAAMAHLDGITPFVSYTNLYINDELFGFYVCVEAYDDSFVERYADSEDTNLYKADSENCTLTSSDDTSGFDLKYGDDENLDTVKNLIEVLNNTNEENKENLEAILNVDSVLKAAAVNTVMGNYDSYSGSKAHNYSLLYNDGKFSYIGWDYNMSIAGFQDDNGSSVTVDVSNPLYNTTAEERPLISKLLEIPEYYEEYLGYIQNLTDYFEGFEDMVNSMSDIIGPYVKDDPSAFYTYDEYKANITKSDADLSQVKNNMNDKNQAPGNGNKPEGEPPAFDNNNMPSPPNGSEPPSGKPEDGQNPPENMTPPSGEDMPKEMNKPDDNGNKPENMGGSMINNATVSIVDYITQRIANIKTQLNI